MSAPTSGGGNAGGGGLRREKSGQEVAASGKLWLRMCVPGCRVSSNNAEGGGGLTPALLSPVSLLRNPVASSRFAGR